VPAARAGGDADVAATTPSATTPTVITASAALADDRVRREWNLCEGRIATLPAPVVRGSGRAAPNVTRERRAEKRRIMLQRKLHGAERRQRARRAVTRG